MNKAKTVRCEQGKGRAINVWTRRRKSNNCVNKAKTVRFTIKGRTTNRVNKAKTVRFTIKGRAIGGKSIYQDLLYICYILYFLCSCRECVLWIIVDQNYVLLDWKCIIINRLWKSVDYNFSYVILHCIRSLMTPMVTKGQLYDKVL